MYFYMITHDLAHTNQPNAGHNRRGAAREGTGLAVQARKGQLISGSSRSAVLRGLADRQPR
jgi:hypothetical protein